PLLDVQAVRHSLRRPRDPAAGVLAPHRALADLPRQRAAHPDVGSDAERGGVPRTRLRRRRLRPTDRGRGDAEGRRADRPRSREAARDPAFPWLHSRVPARGAALGARYAVARHARVFANAIRTRKLAKVAQAKLDAQRSSEQLTRSRLGAGPTSRDEV